MARAQVMQGDLCDRGSLERALADADTCVLCIPEDPTAVDVSAHFRKFARAAAAAVHARSVPRIVFVSSGGRGATPHRGLFAAMHEAEDDLSSAGVALAVLRCGSFMENYRAQLGSLAGEGVFRYPVAGTVPMPVVATRHIARVAAELCLDVSWTTSRALPVQGVEDVSNDEVATRLGRVLDRPLRFEQVPPEAFARGLSSHGASDAYVSSLLAMFRDIEAGACAAEPRTAASTTPTTLETWAREALLPAYERLGPRLT